MTLREFKEPGIDLDGGSILVTGGTGSFGRRFIAAMLARYEPRKLIVFSRDEFKQYEIQQDKRYGAHKALRYFLGDVRDLGRLEMAMRGVDYVIHAAALKQLDPAPIAPEPVAA